MEEQMDQVVALMEARSRGEVENDVVEQAVSGLLSSQPAPSSSQTMVNEDTDEYDDIENDTTVKAPAAASANTTAKTSTGTKPVSKLSLESMRKSADKNINDPLDQIPLGKQGARMMVTFGDGHKPKPEAIAAALLGARKCLQVAIKDARALRRHAQEDYQRARRAVLLGKNKKIRFEPEQQAKVNNDMLYRAMAGYDRLAFDPKCGFDIDQLRQLFPEEMNAYSRWIKMHKSYEASSKDEEANASETEEAETDADSKKNGNESAAGLPGGHLQERAAQFDARTDQMKDDWYLKFSVVRQGSFLPRRSGNTSTDEKQWNAANRQKAQSVRGRRKERGTWESMSAASVRFLHWVGFDPRSALPPPNEETAQALAFLGYDFMGKIVEKAIYLRNVANQKESTSVGDKNLVLELREGEQLDAVDIEKALNDSDIKPMSLYSAPTSDDGPPKEIAAQLYFGPGFEDRLEMEMEELVSGTNKRKAISTEEHENRRKEDSLFEEIEKPPTVLDNISQFIDDDDGDDGPDDDDNDDDGAK